MTTNGISIETPLIYSQPLSKLISREVYLKLESAQPTGSFKLRGISSSCIEKRNAGCTKFVGSSGGNAGLALAYSAHKLKVPCELYVPTYVVPRMLQRFEGYDTKIIITGKNWEEADKVSLEVCKDPQVGYIHPFADPTLWEAYANMVISIKSELEGKKPSCFVVSVGGGGLLCGILRGLDIVGWKDVPVVTMETEGANCFHLSVKAGKLVTKPPVTIAKTLGGSQVNPILMDWLQDYNIISHYLSDKEAARGCVRFADDHGILVEPSCGVTLAALYSDLLPRVLEENGFDSESGPIIPIVCGGSDVTPQMLMDFIKDYDL